ncbi:uncharacterized protein KD926_002130 [Aspergillus affinis]|uniref:uncharacterized protein n=1 Tax=Aspergillus affinis TaxID=1070780 RepID=UPI0022FE33CF|nr:uncharacterized protein KD926_002130 [Aspergillus affinis]KAI9036265.1 hypothetical protein KD926_002130 [Aspergillus affinis]
MSTTTTLIECYLDEIPETHPLKAPPEFYFWGQTGAVAPNPLYSQTEFQSERTILPDTSQQSWEKVVNFALSKVNEVFDHVSGNASTKTTALRELSLSQELQSWRESEHQAGRKLPHKGYGLRQIPKSVINLMGAKNWAAPLLTRAAFHGSGLANMLIGAWDAETLYSNYCVDLVFYYEHGYHKAFAGFESLVRDATTNTRAQNTLGGAERRLATDIIKQYIRQKGHAEERNKTHLTKLSAKLNRDELRAVSLCESSICGLAAEAISRGFDPGATAYQMIFSAPGTDVVDVGSDVYSSELFNSFLNTDDITSSSVISKTSLRRVYDAYAHIGATIFTREWTEPGAIMCAMLYPWHILNDRHYFLRRAVLGSSQVRSRLIDQRCATWEEAFDENGHTTRLSRPLENACDGNIYCDHFEEFLSYSDHKALLRELWYYLVVAPAEYMSQGKVDETRESTLIDALEMGIAKAYSRGMIRELRWLMAHASHHAWQINYLLEAAMFGSLLDDGQLGGRLDRYD